MSEIENLSNKVAEKFIEKQTVNKEIMELNMKLDNLVLREQLKLFSEYKKSMDVA